MSKFPMAGFAFIAACLSVLPTMGDQEVDPKVNFLSEYPEASKRLEAAYSSVNITERFRPQVDSNANPEIIRYLSDGYSARIDFLLDNGSKQSIVANENRYFVVRQEAASDVYRLVKLVHQPKSDSMVVLRQRIRAPFAPYCIMESKISEFISQPKFKIIAAEYVINPSLSKSSQALVKLSWIIPPADSETNATREGWFLFDAEQNWILKEYAFTYNNKGSGRMRAVIQYDDGGKSGFPAVTKIDYFAENDGKRYAPSMATSENSTSDRPSSKEFMLTAFGIPEEVDHASGRMSAPMFLLGLGVLGLAVALYLRRRGQPEV